MLKPQGVRRLLRFSFGKRVFGLVASLAGRAAVLAGRGGGRGGPALAVHRLRCLPSFRPAARVLPAVRRVSAAPLVFSARAGLQASARGIA